MSRRPSSGRPTVPKRSGSADRRNSVSDSRKNESDLVYECKAAYLVIMDDVSDDIESKEQLVQALQQAGRNPTKKVVRKYWTEDTKSVSFDEFVDMCKKLHATSEMELLKAFKKIDINGDGFISNEELTKVMTTRGEDKMTRREVQDIIDEVDENKDGKLDYKEFCKLMLDTQEEAMKKAKSRLERREAKSKKNLRPEASPRLRTKSKEMGSQSSLSQNGIDDIEKEKSSLGSQTSLKSASSHPRKVAKNLDQSKEVNQSKESRKSSEKEKDEDSRSQKEDPKAKGYKAKEKKNETSSKASMEDSEEDSDDADIVVGSQVSLRTPRPSPNKAKDVGPGSQMGSQTSLKSIKSAKCEKEEGPPKPKPRKSLESQAVEHTTGDSRSSQKPKERTKSPVATKRVKLPEPKKLKDWSLVHSKGCFFFEEDGSIVSHHYKLSVPSDTNVWITMEPFSIRPGGDINSAREVGNAPVDTMLLIMREKPDSEGNRLVTFTEQRDTKGRYCVRCDLTRGSYLLIPWTSGCRFQKRKTEPKVETKLIKKDKDDKFVLTKAFKEALADIFEVCDLDGNNLMSREEFNWFNVRSSGEEVADEEWEVVEDNVELKNGELSKNGFIDLNQMEAEDNQGDTEDLWVTLSSMGYNKGLIMDEACAFTMEVYTEDCEAKLRVLALESPGEKAESALCDALISKGEATRVKNMKDLYIHTYLSDFRACTVVENKSRSRVTMNVDCSKSKNVTTNRPELDFTLEVPAKKTVVAHHLIPQNERQEWTVRCSETVVK